MVPGLEPEFKCRRLAALPFAPPGIVESFEDDIEDDCGPAVS